MPLWLSLYIYWRTISWKWRPNEVLFRVTSFTVKDPWHASISIRIKAGTYLLLSPWDSTTIQYWLKEYGYPRLDSSPVDVDLNRIGSHVRNCNVPKSKSEWPNKTRVRATLYAENWAFSRVSLTTDKEHVCPWTSGFARMAQQPIMCTSESYHSVQTKYATEALRRVRAKEKFKACETSKYYRASPSVRLYSDLYSEVCSVTPEWNIFRLNSIVTDDQRDILAQLNGKKDPLPLVAPFVSHNNAYLYMLKIKTSPFDHYRVDPK